MGFFRSKKRVLLVGNEGITLFGSTAYAGIEREIALSWEKPDFIPQLTAALSRQRRNDPVLVLFDGADQTYRKEDNIPKLSSFDRPRFIQRKLEQSFPSYPIRASFEIAAQKQKGGVKEGISYLFVAIPETDNIDKVAAAMLEASVPVAGFGLLPAESAGLVTALSARLFGKKGRKSRWSVLIGQHEAGGLRQVIVKDGRLALTRMTPVSEAGIQGPGWVDDVQREFKATLTYIARFGYTAEDGLDVIVICGDEEKKVFDQKSMPVTNFQCLKTADALSAIGARGRSLGEINFGDAVHAAWSAKKMFLDVPIKVPSIQRILVPRLAARIARTALVLSLLALIGFSFSVYSDYAPLQDSIGQKQQQKAVLAQEYDQEAKLVEALPVKPEVVRKTLAVQGALDKGSINITPTLNLLYKALDKDITLEALSFERGDSAARKPAAKGAPAAQKKAAPEGEFVKIIFRFTLADGLPLETKVERTEKIAETMRRAFTGYDVRINSQFGKISRTGKFEGSAGDTGRKAAADKMESFAEIEMQGAPL
ncbi:MAG: hypothetical protein K8R48_10225 [Alphaproteobacteria bacterium]|nr:hypothetical protein [Alphaproteobacteria bacterium]